MRVRCPNCKAILRVPDKPKPEPVSEPRIPGRLADVLGAVFGCKHPDNVKVDGKCLACEQERKR